MSACRVVQSYISNYGDKLNFGDLLNKNYHIALAQKEYGNHVIQCLLEKEKWYSEQKSFVAFRTQFLRDAFKKVNLLKLSKSKQGSFVLEKCILAADGQDIELLTHRICMKSGHLLTKMVWDGSGNYVLTTLFKNCEPDLKAMIADTVQRYVMNIDSVPYNQLCGSSEFIYKVYRNRRIRRGTRS